MASTCGACHGQGSVRTPCQPCQGQGLINMGGQLQTCPQCGGSREGPPVPCSTCGGSGQLRG